MSHTPAESHIERHRTVYISCQVLFACYKVGPILPAMMASRINSIKDHVSMDSKGTTPLPMSETYGYCVLSLPLSYLSSSEISTSNDEAATSMAVV